MLRPTKSISNERPVIIPGRINGRRTRRRKRAFPGNWERSSAKAAGKPRPSAMATAGAADITLLSTGSQSDASAKSWRYQLRVQPDGGNPPTPEPLNEYTTKTTIGKYRNRYTNNA